MDLQGPRTKGGDRRDQYNPAKSTSDHFVFDSKHDAEGAIEIGVDRLEPAFVGKLGVSSDVADGAAVRQKIYRSQLAARGRHECVDLRLLSHVAGTAEGFSPQLADFGDDFFSRLAA